MHINKKLVFSSALIGLLLFAASCSKKPQDESNGPELEVSSQTLELPDAPKDAPANKGDDALNQNFPPIPENVVKQSLVGVWVLKGESCESSNGIIFDNGGKYASDGEEGLWKASGNKIEIDVSNGESGTEEYPTVDPLRIKVLTLGADAAIIQRPDGSNVEWKRCPSVPNLNTPRAEENAK